MYKIICIGLTAFALHLLAPPTATAGSIAEADALFELGGIQNYAKAIEIYEGLLADDPACFDCAWKCARAHREYGENAKRAKLDDWKKNCAEYGKKGMEYAETARALQPEDPAGHYYYGLCVGIYSDGKSILTALKEGLKDKTQNSFERAYALDRMYDDGGPILYLGRFWAILPWPLKDKKKSLAYYREYQQTPFFENRDEAKVFMVELLIDKGGKANKIEARQILDQAVNTEDPYYRDWAARLLGELK
ncbi:hypothetical protein DSCA_19670 [Desulfosarcina alkanivorans]|uniref:Lipoprotein n=1 Tax=Desulfosarcina alkanivorans TaxID=571177 RepID=A0A5K7YTQ0_9BACT|nr:hypothetical protein [Desulfosarcina alkanivorans]BBO68037.1 hypothetical protein DSCA_19670 [Desulfosarcina alkanivorans]